MLDNRLAVPPRRYRGRLRDLPLPHPASFNEVGRGNQLSFMRRGPWRSFFRRFTAADIRDITRRYHARLQSLLAVDDAVQKIVTTLRETGPNTEYPATYHAIRTNRYLYVEYNTGDRELYDPATDPNELNNRLGDPANASIRAQLVHRLARLETCRGGSCW